METGLLCDCYNSSQIKSANLRTRVAATPTSSPAADDVSIFSSSDINWILDFLSHSTVSRSSLRERPSRSSLTTTSTSPSRAKSKRALGLGGLLAEVGEILHFPFKGVDADSVCPAKASVFSGKETHRGRNHSHVARMTEGRETELSEAH